MKYACLCRLESPLAPARRPLPDDTYDDFRLGPHVAQTTSAATDDFADLSLIDTR